MAVYVGIGLELFIDFLQARRECFNFLLLALASRSKSRMLLSMSLLISSNFLVRINVRWCSPFDSTPPYRR